MTSNNLKSLPGSSQNLQSFKDKVLRIILYEGQKEQKFESLKQVYKQVEIYEKFFLTEDDGHATNQSIHEGKEKIKIHDHKKEVKFDRQPLVDFSSVFDNLNNLKTYVSNEISDIRDLKQFIEMIRKQKRIAVQEKKPPPEPKHQGSIMEQQRAAKSKKDEKHQKTYISRDLNFFVGRRTNTKMLKS